MEEMRDLPPEILILILKDLPFADQLACSETCVAWRDLIRKAVIPSNRKRSFRVVRSEEELKRQIQIFGNSPDFPTGILVENVGSLGPLTGYSKLTDIQFHNLSLLRERDLIQILNDSRESLRSLSLSGCAPRFTMEGLSLLKSSSSLISLDLSNNTTLTDLTFMNFLQKFPQLSTLILNFCRSDRHPRLDIEHSQRDSNSLLSLVFFTFRSVRQVLEFLPVKELDLSRTGTDGPSIASLGSVPGLRLKKLNLSHCSYVTLDGLLDFLKGGGQELESINLGHCRRVFMDYIPGKSSEVFALLAGVKELILTGLSIMKGFEELIFKTSKSLISLDLRGIDVPSPVVMTSFKNVTDNLEELKLVRLSLTQDGILVLSRMKSLKVLDLSCCSGPAATNNLLLSLCTGSVAINLVELYWKRCPLVSDKGLTLLHRLRRLKILELTQAKITFETPGIYFPSLNHLDLSFCELLSPQGLADALTNPSMKYLESLSLQGCELLDDTFINRILVENLSCLRSLNVENCSLLTIQGLTPILSGVTPRLRHLNISFCHRIRGKEVDKIREVSSCFLRDMDRRITPLNSENSHNDTALTSLPPPDC